LTDLTIEAALAIESKIIQWN